VLDLLAAADAILLPVTVLGELEAGFEMGRRGHPGCGRPAADLRRAFPARAWPRLRAAVV